VQVKIADPRLGNGNQSLLLCLLSEVARNKGLNYFGLNLFSEALADNRCGDVPLAEAG